MKKSLALCITLPLLFSAIAGMLSVNFAGAVANPEVSVLSPQNGSTLYAKEVYVVFSVNVSSFYVFPVLEESFEADCLLDNITVDSTPLWGNGTYSIPLLQVSDGPHRLTVKVISSYKVVPSNVTPNGSITVEGSSREINFTVEASPPTVFVLPMNETYNTSTVPLNFTVSEPVSWLGYSLDGQASVTITGNTTLRGLSDGIHNVIISATDLSGKTGSSIGAFFKVATQPSQSNQPTEEPTAEPSSSPVETLTPTPEPTISASSTPTPVATETPSSSPVDTTAPPATTSPSPSETSSPSQEPASSESWFKMQTAILLAAATVVVAVALLILAKRKGQK